MTEDPQRWSQPLTALLGACEAQLQFGIASIGGKDSMSGTFNDIHVPPTLVSFAVGMSTTDKIITATLTGKGQKLYLIKCARDGKGSYKKDHVLRVIKAVKELIDRGEIKNAAVVKSAGVAARVAQMCFGNMLGFDFSDKLSEADLFSKTLGAVIVAIPNDGNAVDKVEMAGGKFLGTTNDTGDFTYAGATLSGKDAVEAYEGKLERIFPTVAKPADMPFAIDVYTDGKPAKAAPGVLKGAKPKVIIPVFPGNNCEIDSARAFERAGADAEVFVIRNRNQNDINESFAELAAKIRESNIMMIPGGFSAGDEPEGSGKFITASLRNSEIADAISDLLDNRDGLVLGICNGFQALIKLGLVPFGKICDMTPDSPTLTFNNIGRHQNKYARTKIMTNKSPWLSLCNPGEIYEIPISHGEGKFAASEEVVKKLAANGQIATCYVDLDGNYASDTQFNPNGSICAIEGITSPDGRVLGKMGHTERYESDLTKNIPGNKYQKIFESGVAYFL